MKKQLPGYTLSRNNRCQNPNDISGMFFALSLDNIIEINTCLVVFQEIYPDTRGELHEVNWIQSHY